MIKKNSFINMKDEISGFAESNNLSLIYFFGSRINKDKINLKSDYDFAFFIDNQTEDISHSIFFKGSLVSQMERIFRIKSVDIVILNNAPPVLSYEIIKNGILLFCKSNEIRTEFEAKVTQKYLDFKFYNEKFNSDYINSIKVNGVL